MNGLGIVTIPSLQVYVIKSTVARNPSQGLLKVSQVRFVQSVNCTIDLLSHLQMQPCLKHSDFRTHGNYEPYNQRRN
jgi:hypothetical protein